MIRQDEYRAGQPVSARKLDELRREVQRLGNVTPIAPVFVKDDGGGIAIGCDVPSLAVFLAYTTSSVSAATGTLPTITPGTGTVTILDFDGTSTSALTTGVAVKNLYKTAAATSKLAFVVFLFGVYWLVAWDC